MAAAAPEAPGPGDAAEVKLVGAVRREAAADDTAYVAIADGAGADVALHCRPWLGSDHGHKKLLCVRERFDNYKMAAITKCILAGIAFSNTLRVERDFKFPG